MINDNPFVPWNNPIYADDPLAPHNSPMERDNPFKPWNSPLGSINDLTPREKRAYHIDAWEDDCY